MPPAEQNPGTPPAGGPQPGRIKSLLYSLWSAGRPPEKAPAPASSAGGTQPGNEAPLAEAFRHPEERPADENLLRAGDSRLYALYRRQEGLEEVPPDELFHLSRFMEDEEAPTEEQRGWLRGLERSAAVRLAKAQAFWGPGAAGNLAETHAEGAAPLAADTPPVGKASETGVAVPHGHAASAGLPSEQLPLKEGTNAALALSSQNASVGQSPPSARPEESTGANISFPESSNDNSPPARSLAENDTRAEAPSAESNGAEANRNNLAGRVSVAAPGFEAEADGQAPPPKAPAPSADPEQPLPAELHLFVGRDAMSAWMFALPPLFSGPELDTETLREALAAKGINSGLLEHRLTALAHSPKYFTLLQIAAGTPAVDGEDGRIVDHYNREVEIHLTVKDDNTIDYKDLGWLQTVEEENVICDILPPTPGTAGLNVLGGEVKGRDGHPAKAPKGQNTHLNPEGTALLATKGGVLSFAGQRFRVDPLLIIHGNVDTATGNLDSVGDILIHGDIQEGFTVQATGNITVQGMVEGAQVLAGGNIQVGRGMNGNAHGQMEAKGDVRCKFIENATVTAGGLIQCDTIINSTVSSDERIEVKTGRGAIIGGNITALDRIDAATIGNQSNRGMVITLGSTANFLREKRDLELRLKEVEAQIAELNKSLRFLSGSQAIASDIDRMRDDWNFKLSVQKLQKSNLERRLLMINRRQTDVSGCRLRAQVVYPPLQITIGAATKILRGTLFNPLIYWKDGEIGTMNV